MASPTSILSKTLQSITRLRIQEIEARRSSYESCKQVFLDKVSAASNQRDRLECLLAAVKELYPADAVREDRIVQ